MKHHILTIFAFVLACLTAGTSRLHAKRSTLAAAFPQSIVVDSVEYDYDDEIENRVVPPYVNTVCPDVPLKMCNGMAVTGSGPQIRVFAPWKGVLRGVLPFADIAKTYADTLGPDVTVWLMPIPTAAAFYSPAGSEQTDEEYSTLNYLFEHTPRSVRCVDVHTILGLHAAEDIYARTDHHWLPLGAYYAAKRFATLAGLPFRDIRDTTAYSEHVIRDFCGTMYKYSRNIEVKRNPELFIYWKPVAVDYTTDFTTYTFAAPHRVTGEKGPLRDKYFRDYPDGAAAAYCTFLGGDARLTHVKTSTRTGRRVLFVKDSFGNAIPGYLFYSFDELHVVDCRFFNKNLTEYVHDHNITDVVLCNNLKFMADKKIQDAVLGYLTQNPTR